MSKGFETQTLGLKDNYGQLLNANLLSINFNKTHYIQFTTKNKHKTHIKITYDDKPQQYPTSNFLESVLMIQ
jgi:hypothetical protein